MIITNKVNMDLMRQPWAAPINAVQDDRYCRNLEMTLTAGGEAWMIPEDAAVLVRYKKPDGTGGEYDTLPDGTQAWSVSENIVTIGLAPQVLTKPGPVNLSVTLLRENKQLSTFSVLVNVAPRPGADPMESGDYVNVAGFLPGPINGSVGQYLKILAVDDIGRVTRVEAVDIGKDALTEESDPTVPEWAKQPEKPRYSAEEVGALGEYVQVDISDQYASAWEAKSPWGGSSGSPATFFTNASDRCSLTTPLCFSEAVKAGCSEGYKWSYHSWNGPTGSLIRDYGWQSGIVEIPAGLHVTFTIAKNDNSVMSLEDTAHLQIYGSRKLVETLEQNGNAIQENRERIRSLEKRPVPPIVRAINHRGYCNEAPENTLSAYRLSKNKGFDIVECDVFSTSDGVPVLLHDASVDRTSNGSGNISEMTLEAVKALDFGSWFSEDYAGEKIPTLEEFLLLCRSLSLHAYLDLRIASTATEAAMLVTLVKKCGMSGHVTWLGDREKLEKIRACDKKARLALTVSMITDAVIADAVSLKNGENQVVINCDHSALTDEMVALCLEIPADITEDYAPYWEAKGPGSGSSASASTWFGNSENRISMTTPVYLENSITAECKTGYKFSYHIWAGLTGALSSDSGWKTEAQTLAAGNYVTFSMARTDGAQLKVSDYVNLVLYGKSTESMPLEVWTVNDVSVLKSLNPYVSGVTSDTLIAWKELQDANV